MEIYNLTEFPAVIVTKEEKYSLPPHAMRFELPVPQSMLTDVGFAQPVDLFVGLGECPTFHWNDIVIVTPEQFAAFKFNCEVWIASGERRGTFMRMCRVQLAVEPPEVEVEIVPTITADYAHRIIIKAMSDAAQSHNLSSGEVAYIRNKLNLGAVTENAEELIRLAQNPKKLKQTINAALAELGYTFH